MEDGCLRASFTANVSPLRFAYFFLLTFDLNSFREFINLLLPVYNFFFFFFYEVHNTFLCNRNNVIEIINRY